MASSFFTGATLLGHIDVGINLTRGGFEAMPYIGVDPLYLYQPPFSESGAESIDLDVRSSQAFAVRSEAGVRLSQCLPRRLGQLHLGGTLAFVREDRFAGAYYEASFAHVDCTFQVIGLNPERNIFAPSVEVGFLDWDDSWSVLASYQGQFASHFTDHGFALRLSHQF